MKKQELVRYICKTCEKPFFAPRVGNRKYCSKFCHKKFRYSKDMNLLLSIKARARELKIPFNLTIEDIQSNGICPVFEIEFDSSSSETRATIDRIIPSRGYVKDNIKIICGRANRLKNDATLEELEKIIQYVKENT